MGIELSTRTKQCCILVVACCLPVLAGCGKKADPVQPQDDTTPPRVLASYPADLDTGLPRNTVIYVTFSEPMNKNSAQAAFNAGGAAGFFHWFGSSMVFVPAAPFPFLDTVRYSVASTAQDLAGNGLSPALNRRFVTGIASDNIRPTVSALQPAAGASGVSVGATITMRVSEPITQFIAGGVRLYDSLGQSISGNTSWQDSVTVAFNPTADLAANMRYTVIVDTILRDRCWNRNEPASWQFTTELDLIPPTVTSVSPANGSDAASLKDSIMVTFSEPMDTASARAAFTMNPAISGTFSWSGMTILKFKPSQVLAVRRTYQLTISNTARDRNGVPMAAPFNSSFTTDRVIYAAGTQANKIYVLARSTGEEMQRISVTNPVGLDCSPDGSKLYVLTGGAAGSLKVLDPANAHQQLRSVGLGNQPYALSLSASGNRLAVSNYGSGTVTVIDTMGWSVASFSVEAGPRGVAFGIGSIFVACADAARLSAYTPAGAFVQNVVIHGASKMLCLSGGRDTVYLCEGNQISAFLASNLTWLGSAITDCGDVIRAGGYLYVTDPLNPRVRAYSPTPSGNNIGHVKDIAINSAARDLCASADGSRVFSANGTTGTISEISTASNTVVKTITVGAALDAVAASP